MSLISKPQDKTDNQKVAEMNFSILQALKNHARQTFDLAWKKLDGFHVVNKSKAEVQAFFDVLGANGGLALQAHAKEQELIYLIDNTWVPLVPPLAYTINEQTGVVTIGDA